MKNILLLLLFFGAGAHGTACDFMFAYGYPVSQVSIVPLCYIAYFTGYSNDKKGPIYSSEYLISENISKDVPRVDAFKPDPNVDRRFSAEVSDYRGYDKGHMVPFEDTRINSVAALQSFYLSNIVPQNAHFNRGLWRRLENKVRQWSLESSRGLYVYTGAIYGNVRVGNNGIAVPTHMFKIILNKDTMSTISFIIPNVAPEKEAELMKYLTTIRYIENISGIDFFPELPWRLEYIMEMNSITYLDDL